LTQQARTQHLPYPAWWSYRDRWAVRLGRRFWPALYLAPRATRDRWAAVSEIIGAAGGDEEAALQTSAHLEREGMLPAGTTDELYAWYALDEWRM
jgi:hypothetical protein